MMTLKRISNFSHQAKFYWYTMSSVSNLLLTFSTSNTDFLKLLVISDADSYLFVEDELRAGDMVSVIRAG
jgi:hypothetical protein